MAAAALLDQGDGVRGAAAGGQHGIQQDQLALLSVRGKLAVVFHGLQGLGVAIQADMADAAGRNHVHDAIHHAQAGAQNRYDAQLLAGQHLLGGLAQRSLDLHVNSGQITGHFIDHQHGDLLQQLAELLGAGGGLTHDGQLVLNQGMIENMNLAHG